MLGVIGGVKTLEDILVLRPHQRNRELLSILPDEGHDVLREQNVGVVRPESVAAYENFHLLSVRAAIGIDDGKIHIHCWNA